MSASDLYMLTVEETAEELGVGVTAVREKIKTKELEPIYWGNSPRFPRWYIREWQQHQIHRNAQRVSELIGGKLAGVSETRK